MSALSWLGALVAIVGKPNVGKSAFLMPLWDGIGPCDSLFPEPPGCPGRKYPRGWSSSSAGGYSRDEEGATVGACGSAKAEEYLEQADFVVVVSRPEHPF